MRLEQLGKLGVAHQVIFVEVSKQFHLCGLNHEQMFLEQVGIQYERRFGEHADGQVNQPEFRCRKTVTHKQEYGVGQLNVVLAILTVSG